MPFKKHRCTLGLGSDSKLPKATSLLARIGLSLMKLGQISQHHPETYDRFYSYPAVLAERQRHLYEGGRFLIHPFSIFSFIWASVMVFANLGHMCCSTFRLSYIVVPIEELETHFVDYIILALNLICWFDIIIKFNTGYVLGKLTNIVIDRKMIARRYLRWLFFDLLSTIPFAYVILQLYPDETRILLVAHFIACLRCTRIYTVIVDVKILMKLWTKSYIWHGCVRHAMVFAVTCHWSSCVIYLPAVIAHYWYNSIPATFTTFLNGGGHSSSSILSYAITERYRKCFFVAMSAFFGTGFSMLITTEYQEIIPFALVILYAAMFMLYNFVFLLKIYVTKYSSTVRYHELTNQVEEYMSRNKFPLQLKKRARDFYYYRYQEKYFNEGHVIRSLSESLRNEITLHTCSKLVEKVALFQGAQPHVMGSILGCLKPQVYLPNESVVRAGETGHCMFFIANGTVAVYSLKGAEVCHLEDGAHFGEGALLMKDSKRVATVIAIEVTLLYRLDWEDFKQYIMNDDMLYERIEALATQRMHETVVLDESFGRGRGAERQPEGATDVQHSPRSPFPGDTKDTKN